MVGVVGAEARHPQAAADLVQGDRDVEVLVGVDAERHRAGGGHVGSFRWAAGM
jgi:hypothetical protein